MKEKFKYESKNMSKMAQYGRKEGTKSKYKIIFQKGIRYFGQKCTLEKISGKCFVF
jgi:hypothetical protein